MANVSGEVAESFEIPIADEALFLKQAKENIAAARLGAFGWACGLIIAVLFFEWAVGADMGYKDRVAVFP
jgi:hypothetical protein